MPLFRFGLWAVGKGFILRFLNETPHLVREFPNFGSVSCYERACHPNRIAEEEPLVEDLPRSEGGEVGIPSQSEDRNPVEGLGSGGYRPDCSGRCRDRAALSPTARKRRRTQRRHPSPRTGTQGGDRIATGRSRRLRARRPAGHSWPSCPIG